MTDHLSSPPHPLAHPPRFASLRGNQKILEGKQAPDIIDRNKGIERFRDYQALNVDIHNLTVRRSSSPFATTFAQGLDMTLEKSEELGDQLTKAELLTNFGVSDHEDLEYNGEIREFKMIAKLIKLRARPCCPLDCTPECRAPHQLSSFSARPGRLTSGARICVFGCCGHADHLAPLCLSAP